MNDVAKNEINNDANYLNNLLQTISGYVNLDKGYEIDIKYTQGEKERYFMIKTFFLEWNNSNAKIFAISDVSATKNKIRELEIQAYRDSITQLYNRTFGMLTLDSWLHEKKQFILVFADLDNLKYINDEFGHNEGDIYILNAAKYLRTFSAEAVVCRLGGDEFMLLVSNLGYDGAYATMEKIFNNFQKDEYLIDKTYSYSISFGIVAVEKDNKLPASDILSIADERMYAHKRLRKKERKKSVNEPLTDTPEKKAD
jgi:diguanylate cyclase (GGDEF)-like protein